MPPHAIFVAWREASVANIPMRAKGLSWAAAAQVFVAVVGESLPRSSGELAVSTISGIVGYAGSVCVDEDGIAGR